MRALVHVEKDEALHREGLVRRRQRVDDTELPSSDGGDARERLHDLDDEDQDVQGAYPDEPQPHGRGRGTLVLCEL